MSATADYELDVNSRGWVYLPQLPSNTPLGRSAGGRPGARSPWSPKGSSYELAPALAQIEQGFQHAVQAVVDAEALGNLAVVEARDSAFDVFDDQLTHAAEAIGLDHGLGGVVAKAIGVPPWVLMIALFFFLYAAARAYRIVPPLSQVFR